VKYNPVVVVAYFKSCGIPKPELEYRFCERKWKFDFCWPDHKLYLEVNGGIWINGRHSRGAEMKKDWEKWNTAASFGWRGVYCEPKDLLTADMAVTLVQCLWPGCLGPART
jgi:hypothetical protein